jgi:GntR family transcriptional regulator
MSTTAPGRPKPAPTLQVDLSSPTPPYEQLREQIAGLIATGGLQAGERLPPVRQLAADLGLASGTVARSYQELEQAGLVEGRGRHGTIVPAAAEADAENQSRHQALSAAADNVASTARELGLSDEAALAAVRSALVRLRVQQA